MSDGTPSRIERAAAKALKVADEHAAIIARVDCDTVEGLVAFTLSAVRMKQAAEELHRVAEMKIAMERGRAEGRGDADDE